MLTCFQKLRHVHVCVSYISWYVYIYILGRALLITKILLTARKVRLPARLVFDVVSIFTTPGKFSQELPRVYVL